MKRYHLFEFSDQSFLPRLWRQYLCELIGEMTSRSYLASIPLLTQSIHKNKVSSVHDLCSGSAVFWIKNLSTVRIESKRGFNLILSDKFKAALPPKPWDHSVSIQTDESDIKNLPPREDEMYTIYSGIHHFKPAELQNILYHIQKNGNPFFAFECTKRSWKNLALIPISTILAIWVSLTFRPILISRVFWTCVFPVIPILYLWDGLVSHLRSYHPKELEAICNTLSTPKYHWKPFETNELIVLEGSPYSAPDHH